MINLVNTSEVLESKLSLSVADAIEYYITFERIEPRSHKSDSRRGTIGSSVYGTILESPEDVNREHRITEMGFTNVSSSSLTITIRIYDGTLGTQIYSALLNEQEKLVYANGFWTTYSVDGLKICCVEKNAILGADFDRRDFEPSDFLTN